MIDNNELCSLEWNSSKIDKYLIYLILIDLSKKDEK